MAKLMNQMGIKNEAVPASRVIIEKDDGSRLVVNNPQVVLLEMGGQKTLQVSGDFAEEKEAEPSDAEVVMQAVPSASRKEAEEALKQAGGDIAAAVMLLEKKEKELAQRDRS